MWWMLAAIAIAACTDGPAGSAGSGSPPGQVVVRTDPASTAECPFGGLVVKSGTDRNRDSVLQDAEVQASTVVCSAMPAQPPPKVVVRLVAEPPGTHCAAGGTAVQSGPDDNRNGQLDDAEVAHIDYVCNPTNAALRTRIVSLPPGAQCPAGGIEFQAGRDSNGNGQLDDGEVESRTVSCGDVVAGNLEIKTDADMSAAANVRVVTGFLRVVGENVHSVSLPHLEQVGSGLQAFGLALSGFDLPVLQEVGGALALSGRGPIHCPQLRRVGGLELATSGVADLGGFPALREIAGRLRLLEMTSLVSVDLSSVVIRGDIEIQSNPGLTHIGLAVNGNAGTVSIFENAALETLDLSATAQAPASAELGDVFVFLNPRIAHVALRAGRVHSFALSDGPKVADIALDVAKFDDDVFVADSTTPFRLALSSPDPDGLEIGHDLLLDGPLASFEVTAALRIRGSFQLDGTQLEALDLPHPLPVGDFLTIGTNPRLTRVSPILLGGGLVVVDNALLRDIDFVSPAVPGVLGELEIADNPVLERASSLDALAVVHGAVRIERNPRLTGVLGPSLTRIDRALIVNGNAGLTALRLPGLRDGVTDLMVQSNAALEAVELPALTGVRSSIGIATNPELQHIAFDALAQAPAFAVTDNPHLPACEVDAVFAHVAGGNNHQSGNDDTASCP
jgi:hypothetical protein